MESKLGAMASKHSSVARQPPALQVGFLHLPRKKPKTVPQPPTDELPSKVGDRVADFVAKDLRIKRVFSPNLVNRSLVRSGEQISDKEGKITANGTCPNENIGVGKTSDTAKVRNESFRNSNGQVESDEDRRCNGKSEELVHSTPPDGEILTGGFVAAPRSSNGDILENTCAKSDCRIDSVARTGSVLKPCSKRKLFKAPGSIAYKRLLPFLLDSDNYTLHDDSNSKRENNLEKKANIESNLCNHAKVSSFVGSDTCVKNATFASGMSCKTMKLNVPPPDNGDTKKFQNGGSLNNGQNIIKEDSGLKKDSVGWDSSLEERLTEHGGPTKYHQIEDHSSKEQPKTSEMERLDGGTSFTSEVDNFKSHVSDKLCNNVPEAIKREDLKMSLIYNVVCNPLKEESRDEKVGCTQGADPKLGSSTVGENHCNIATENDKKYGTYVRNKMVRNPLVQLKSKYSQVSVSYRRMLPFLEDLFKDNPENCASGNIDSSVPEKELPTMNLQSPSSNSRNSQDKSEGLVTCNMPFDGNSDNLSMPGLNSMNETVCETDKLLSPPMPGVDNKLLSPPKSQLHSEQEMLDRCKLKMGPQFPGATLLNDRAVLSLYPEASYDPLTEDASRLTSEQSPITEDCTSLKDNVSDSANISERSCEGGCILPESQINLRKGILKRNPRGCRGICNCLSCSSFRLHAERAFEFSRNQLQDAEEVASDLMKELSFLRGVLEKYPDGAKGDAEYHHSNEVKEACRKASEAELIAKDRLVQMNYELDIHCRITCSQRPNVKFSGEVEKIDK